jgi:hypothetical protein
MPYTISYNTGAGDESDIDTLDEAMTTADEGARYTQQDIDIVDDVTGETLTRKWCGCLDGLDESSDPIQFGSFGYYADWA